MNWLFWIVVALIVVMLLWGHYRGFFKMAVGLVAIVIAIVGTGLIGGPIAKKVYESNIRTSMEKTVNEFIEDNITGDLENLVKTTQDQSIDELPLPESIRNRLKEHNSMEKYQELGVTSFREYLCRYLIQMIIYAAVYALSFIVLFVAAHIVFYLLDVVAMLPGVHGVNQLAGAVLGLVHALIYIWVFFLIMTACSGKAWGATCLGMVKDSPFLSLLYDNNLLLRWILMWIF